MSETVNRDPSCESDFDPTPFNMALKISHRAVEQRLYTTRDYQQ